MSETKPDKGPLRYRMYFWLMNVAFVCGVLGTVNHWIAVLRSASPLDFTDPFWFITGFIVISLNFFLPLFLLLARFMRDEYAEQLWRRTVALLAYFVAITPFLLWLVLSTLKQLGEGGQSYSLTSPFFANVRYIGIVYDLWMTYMLVFVFIFHFLRWKDTRA